MADEATLFSILSGSNFMNLGTSRDSHLIDLLNGCVIYNFIFLGLLVDLVELT